MAILSSLQGNNSDLFPSILALYVPDGSRIFDATYGKGAFWSKVDISKYKLTTNDLVQQADVHLDFRDTKYPSDSFDVVILDPPYAYSPKSTMKNSIASCYGLNNSVDISNMSKVLNLYLAGIDEAYRILPMGGLLIIKTQDIIEGGKQWWMHTKMMEQSGFFCEDLMVLVQSSIPASDPKWKVQKHARKNHSFFVVLRKKGIRKLGTSSI